MTRLAIVLLVAAGAALAQTAEKKFVFEAATIKPAAPGADGSSWHSRPGRVVITNYTLKRCIMTAYDLRDYQVTGGPKWMNSDAYDINAKLEDQEKPPTGKEGDIQVRAALQALLAERFHLEIHRETKSMTAYSLVVAPKGLKIKPVESTGSSGSNTGRGRMTATGVSMDRLATNLSRMLELPVVDQTGVSGVFNFKLEWAPDEVKEASLDKPADVSIYTALQEQLGLKLESRKTDVPMIVVDRAEKPTEN